ncbi:flagellar motor protein MotB [Pseudokineococcus basanitobsidens]|uniref:Flagellar motor protein MotB n=1 Tax=Pseudokineococcus basanitobsidens TaxID=1926649 RepID=A0ABU8RG71_9ACTN
MSAGGAHGRARRGGGHDEGGHDGPDERWLVSYADMITVLMALFIVLFAISQVDAQKFLELRQGLADGVGASATIPVDGGSGLLESNGSVAAPASPQVSVQNESLDVSAGASGASAGSAADSAGPAMDAAREEVQRLDDLQRQLDAALQSGGLGDRVDFRVTDRGLVGAIVADDVFFESSSAVIRETGQDVLDAMAPVLADAPQPLDLEGHTNSLPVRGGVYPSNWELSAARAAAVVRYLQADGIAPERMTALGYGETRPLYPGGDEKALTGNRRVDLVVVSDQPAEVKALLPKAQAELDAGAAPPAVDVAPQPVAVAPAVEASAADTAAADGH